MIFYQAYLQLPMQFVQSPCSFLKSRLPTIKLKTVQGEPTRVVFVSCLFACSVCVAYNLSLVPCIVTPYILVATQDLIILSSSNPEAYLTTSEQRELDSTFLLYPYHA